VTLRATIGLALVGGAVLTFAAMPQTPAHAQCSVFDRHPCVPSVCSVFQRGPCFPEFEPPIGQDLRLTIESRNAEGEGGHKPEHDLNTLRELFAALRACWVPPAKEEARPGMQVSVRFSFKRNGEIIGKPRETYVSPDAPVEARKIYCEAVAAALARCTPMPFTKGLGGALAGRPIAIRFTDNRT
jgi:hypothetical protein